MFFKVLFERLKATGVEYYRHAVPRAAYASKEVILCAGAFISPVILMRSGVGRREQLDVSITKNYACIEIIKKSRILKWS